jgi:superfamily II DNA or RNA helicase
MDMHMNMQQIVNDKPIINTPTVDIANIQMIDDYDLAMDIKKPRVANIKIVDDDKKKDMKITHGADFIIDIQKTNVNNVNNANVVNGANDDVLMEKKPQYLKDIMSLRQDIELLKVDSICEMAKKHLREDKSVVIFVNFTNTIFELKKKLKTNCLVWGLQKIEERNKAVSDFCADISRIIICNIKAGSEGLSLHDTNGKYARVSLICPTWSAQELLQALGRIHRATGKTDCLQEIIYCKNTVEESMSVVIQNKINNIKLFNDGKINLKNDNLEVLLKNAYKKRMKEEQKKLYVFETMDYEKIQDIIDGLNSKIKYTQYKLYKYNIDINRRNQLKYEMDVLNKEMDFYCKQLNLLVEQQINLCD